MWLRFGGGGLEGDESGEQKGFEDLVVEFLLCGEVLLELVEGFVFDILEGEVGEVGEEFLELFFVGWVVGCGLASEVWVGGEFLLEFLRGVVASYPFEEEREEFECGVEASLDVGLVFDEVVGAGIEKEGAGEDLAFVVEEDFVDLLVGDEVGAGDGFVLEGGAAPGAGSFLLEGFGVLGEAALHERAELFLWDEGFGVYEAAA